VGDLLGQVIFILLVLTFYTLFKPVNKNISSLIVIFALVGIPITMLNSFNHFAVIHILSKPEYLTVFEPAQLDALVLLFLNLLNIGIQISSIFWGLWLLPLGYLVYKSGYFPKVLGIFLFINGIAYLIDFIVISLFPDYITIVAMSSNFIGIISLFGELSFMFWLLLRGANIPKMESNDLVVTLDRSRHIR